MVRRKLPDDPGAAIKAIRDIESTGIYFNVNYASTKGWHFAEFKLEDYLGKGPFFGRFTDKLYIAPNRHIEKKVLKIRKYQNYLTIDCGRFRMTYFNSENFSFGDANNELFFKHYFGMKGITRDFP